MIQINRLSRIIIGILLLLGLGNSSFAQETQIPSLKVGQEAPLFSLKTDGGQKYTLIQFRNVKPVIIELFLTTCPHCQRSSGWIQYLYAQDKGKLAVLAINADSLNKHFGTDADFRKKFKVTYPVLDNPPIDLVRAYQISTFPWVGIVNTQGKLVWIHQGEILPHDVVDMEKAIRPLLHN